MTDGPDDLRKLPSPASAESTSNTTSDLFARPIDGQLGPRHVVEEFAALSLQSGPSVAIAAFGNLPEPIQRQQLENDHQRTRMNFELESKQIDTDQRDRDNDRADKFARFEMTRAYEEKHESRVFKLVAGIIIGLGAAVGLFAYLEQWAIVTHMTAGILALGVGYQGGKSSGYLKAKKELGRGSE